MWLGTAALHILDIIGTFFHACREGRFSESIVYTLPQPDFVITIPADLDVFTCDVGNFSIWCRDFFVFFTVLSLDGELFVSRTAS